MFRDATPAGRRYALRLGVSMAVYGAIFLSARPFTTAYASASLRWGIALGLAGAVTGVLGAIGRYLVEEDDEYLRMRQAQAVILATGLTLSVCTLWGYLALMRLVGDLPAVDVFPLFSASWLLVTGLRRVLGR